MKNKTLAHIHHVIIFLLVLLFSYTAASKLIDIEAFERQLRQQYFDSWLVDLLLWGLPAVELGTAWLLIWAKTRELGFYLALVLMAMFTAYVAAALFGFYEKLPCSCGGVLKHMGWKLHFWFNLFFLLLTIIGNQLTKKQQRNRQRSHELGSW